MSSSTESYPSAVGIDTSYSVSAEQNEDFNPSLVPLPEDNAFVNSFEAALNQELDRELEAERDEHLPAAGLSASDPLETPFDQPSSWFTPGHHENATIDYHPENLWYPFESEIFARLFVFVNCRTNPLSRQQLLRVWDLLGRFSKVPVPPFSAVSNFSTSIPRPRTYEMQTEETISKSYSQISITDIIRMQLAIPETHQLLQQHSVIVQNNSQVLPQVATTTSSGNLNGRLQHARKELWTGSKWHTTPSLQPPNTLLENGEEAWFGMIIEFAPPSDHEMIPPSRLSTSANERQYGIFCGQSLLEFNQTTTHRLHYHPLEQISEGFLFPHSELEIDQNSIRYIDRMLVTKTFRASHPADRQAELIRRSVYTCTTMTNPGRTRVLTIPSQSSFDQIFGLHPVLTNRNKISPGLPITVANISLWQDGLSGNASKKWNPHEACIMSLAGLPREVGFLIFLQFHI